MTGATTCVDRCHNKKITSALTKITEVIKGAITENDSFYNRKLQLS